MRRATHNPGRDSSFARHGLRIGHFCEESKSALECNLVDARHKFISPLLNGERVGNNRPGQELGDKPQGDCPVPTSLQYPA